MTSRVLHSGKRVKKTKFLPRVQRWMAPTASNLPRVLGRHSGKASPSARDLALGEGPLPRVHAHQLSGKSTAPIQPAHHPPAHHPPNPKTPPHHPPPRRPTRPLTCRHPNPPLSDPGPAATPTLPSQIQGGARRSGLGASRGARRSGRRAGLGAARGLELLPPRRMDGGGLELLPSSAHGRRRHLLR
jgi:hypothetical protein